MASAQPENKIGIGTLLVGKYRVTRELGRGGMAAVYEAEHVNIGKRVAVKVLAAELSNSAIVIERFMREARAAASVKSPYIVEVYDSGRLEDGRPFIAMELLEGESLYDRMARIRLIDPQTTVRIIGQVARGLTKAHAIGIVHRDLKPENIHLCKGEDGEEVAKILDFGLAKFYSPVKTDEKTARLTREGAVFGTPAYMSPEQVKGQGSVDHRADLWALGCMAYECLTGRPVWNTEQGVAMTFAAIAASQLPLPSRYRPDLPPGFDGWFKKALERDPANRFQTAKELADELARALETPPISLINASAPSQIELEAIAGLQEVQRDPEPPSSKRSGIKPATPGAGVDEESEPLDLLTLSSSNASATDLPPTATPEGPPSASRRRQSPGAGRFALWVMIAGAAGTGGYFGYTKVLHPRLAAKPVPVAAPVASTSAAAASSAPATPAPPEQPKWMTPIEEGQALLASGDADGAMRKFKDASDAGGGAIAKSFLDQVKLGAATAGPCKVAAFSHPRLGYGGNVGRPAIAVTSKGAVVAWTDDHEQPGHDHVYSVLIDPVGKPTSAPRDLTPEADYAMRPSLLAVDDRVALLFWDRSGRDPGVKVRWLDADGRIGGMSIAIGGAKPGMYWPALERAPDGSGFWVAWQASPDKDGDDVFLRKLDAELQPHGPEVRATNYGAEKGKTAQVGSPNVAVSSANLFVAYALDRDKLHAIERMRIGLSSPDLQSGGLTDKAAKPELSDTVVVNEDKVGGDYPSIACTKDSCFLVWHEIDKTPPDKNGEKGAGAVAALIDPVRGTVLWRKRFAPKGSHPAVAFTEDGPAEVAFYEAGKVRVAPISRDGVGTTTTFAKVTGDEPRPWIAAGRTRGEWYVSWLDIEAGHTEAFVARLQCRN
jgi:serine/threonine-protein kinase